MKIAIVGASGFVGSQLLNKITSTYQCQALSRSTPPVSGNYKWNKCDLHNLKDLEQGLSGCNVAIYLVHSMLASSGLNQGKFQDFDISLADNFARAAKSSGIERVIYLSGIIPDSNLSAHLKSRLEVENLLGSYFPKMTTLRAGLIIGDKGSSFTMMYRLARKLPIMLCPSWTKTLSQPIYIEDVVRSIEYCLSDDLTHGKTYDIGSPTATSYEAMMKLIGSRISREPKIFHIDTIYPTLSSLWVTLISGAPLELTRPLVGSLKEPMLVRKDCKLPFSESFLEFPEALDRVLESSELEKFKPPHAFKVWIKRQKQKHVRSIQRLTAPNHWNVERLSEEYAKWLPKIMKGAIRTEVTEKSISFKIALTNLELLKLSISKDRTDCTRRLFYITCGLLVSSSNEKGRLEFRALPNSDHVLVAIHDFIPSLPWPVYRFTQAIVHKWVMMRFGEHLNNIPRDNQSSALSKNLKSQKGAS